MSAESPPGHAPRQAVRAAVGAVLLEAWCRIVCGGLIRVGAGERWPTVAEVEKRVVISQSENLAKIVLDAVRFYEKEGVVRRVYDPEAKAHRIEVLDSFRLLARLDTCRVQAGITPVPTAG